MKNSLYRTASPHEGERVPVSPGSSTRYEDHAGYVTDDCRYGWHEGNPLETEGGACPGYDEDGTCTCKCHNEKEED